MVREPPITLRLDVTLRPVPADTVPVATVPRVEGVPLPVQYASPPMVGTDDVLTAP